jgi:xanthine dehydrogenase accessory factor
MVVGPNGEVVGSVSGGCVEAAVYELSRKAAATGTPALVRYGITGGDPYAPGLTCGGKLDVFASPVSAATFPGLDGVAQDVDGGRPVAVATIVEHPARRRAQRVPQLRPGSAAARGGHAGLRTVVRPSAAHPRARCHRRRRGCREDGQLPRLSSHGLRRPIAVRDLRPVPRRRRGGRRLAAPVPAAGGRGWQPRLEICVLTHDPKFDVPVLSLALRIPQLAYVGAMGSRRTHLERLERLRAAGLTETELSRLSSQVGLDLDGRTPEETAVSIAAEIIAARSGGSGRPLRDLLQPIHLPTK